MNIKPFVLAAALVATCATQAYAQETADDATANLRPATTTAASATFAGTKQSAGIAIAKIATKNPATTFSPDYSRALTPGQMTAAWQAELERLMPTPPTSP